MSLAPYLVAFYCKNVQVSFSVAAYVSLTALWGIENFSCM